jgi:hypothetical protein
MPPLVLADEEGSGKADAAASRILLKSTFFVPADFPSEARSTSSTERRVEPS